MSALLTWTVTVAVTDSPSAAVFLSTVRVISAPGKSSSRMSLLALPPVVAGVYPSPSVTATVTSARAAYAVLPLVVTV